MKTIVRLSCAATALMFATVFPLKAEDSFESLTSRASIKRIVNSARKFSMPGLYKVPEAASSNSQAAPKLPLAYTKKLTVIVYMNAKNDLEGAGLNNLNQMELVGSNNELNIVAELGRIKGMQNKDSVEDGDWNGARRYYVTQDADPKLGGISAAMSKINSPVLQELPNVDMGDYRHAAEFIKWAKANFPAKQYVLVMWNHGTGWADPKTKAISLDAQTNNFIKTEDIQKMLAAAGGVDLLVYDACLMQMAEVAYEARNYAKIIVGSEENVPGGGLPYYNILAAAAVMPGSSVKQIAQNIVNTYTFSYRETSNMTGKPVTMSAIDASKMDILAQKIKTWVDTVMTHPNALALQQAKTYVLRFQQFGSKDPYKMLSSYGDLYNFVDLVRQNIISTEVTGASVDLLDFISSELIIANSGMGTDASGNDYANAHGIAINIPFADTTYKPDYIQSMNYSNSYSDMTFAQASGWGAFCKWLENYGELK